MVLNIYFALVLLDFSNEFKRLFASQFSSLKAKQNPFTPLEIIPRCSATGLDSRIIPAGFNAPPEFLTGFTFSMPFVALKYQ